MTQVNTVLGPVDCAELGFTLMHEHILVGNWTMRQQFPGWFDREIVVKQGVDALRAARACGVRTIVDATPVNLGRDVALVTEIAEKAQMQVIVATGFYWIEEPWMAGWEPDRLVERLLRDVTHGIQGTGVKAGIIKCATDRDGVTPVNRKLLQVAARLHRATGLPITAHTDAERRTGLALQEVLIEEGADLRRTVIGHCGDTSDAAYLESILARGSFIGMDRFGHEQIYPTVKRVQIAAEMCRRGHAGRMVLAHDGDVYSDWSPEALAQHAAGKRPLPFCHIATEVFPLLRKAGVSDAQLQQMAVANPRSVFEGI